MTQQGGIILNGAVIHNGVAIFFQYIFILQEYYRGVGFLVEGMLRPKWTMVNFRHE